MAGQSVSLQGRPAGEGELNPRRCLGLSTRYPDLFHAPKEGAAFVSLQGHIRAGNSSGTKESGGYDFQGQFERVRHIF